MLGAYFFPICAHFLELLAILMPYSAVLAVPGLRPGGVIPGSPTLGDQPLRAPRSTLEL